MKEFDSWRVQKAKTFVCHLINVMTMCLAMWLNLIAQWIMLEDPTAGLSEEQIAAMTTWEQQRFTIYGSALTMFVAVGLAALWSIVAKMLTEWENWSRQSEYDDVLIIRELSFQCVNFYFSLFFVAFGKWGHLGVFPKSIFEERDIPPGSRMPDLQFQLMLVFTAKLYGKQVVNFFKPFILGFVKKVTAGEGICVEVDSKAAQGRERERTQRETEHDGAVNREKAARITRHWINLQYWLEEYNEPNVPTCYDDWLEMTIQFGFLVLFSPAFPLGPLMAWLSVMLELRLDATALCRAHQRPRWEAVESIGTWEDVISGLTTIGVITNSLITSFVSVQTEIFFGIEVAATNTTVPFLVREFGADADYFLEEADKSSISERVENHKLWLICLALEHAVLLARVLIQAAVPDEPSWVGDAKDALEVARTSGEMMTEAERFQREAASAKMRSDIAQHAADLDALGGLGATMKVISAAAKFKKGLSPSSRRVVETFEVVQDARTVANPLSQLNSAYPRSPPKRDFALSSSLGGGGQGAHASTLKMKVEVLEHKLAQRDALMSHMGVQISEVEEGQAQQLGTIRVGVEALRKQNQQLKEQLDLSRGREHMLSSELEATQSEDAVIGGRGGAEGRGATFAIGDDAEYFSKSNGGWLKVKVQSVQSDGRLSLRGQNVKSSYRDGKRAWANVERYKVRQWRFGRGPESASPPQRPPEMEERLAETMRRIHAVSDAV